jgi:uncharacterized HAD superfamily protein/adenine/guanine phosphoribosyltransferase-like PRPP-binding protein
MNTAAAAPDLRSLWRRSTDAVLPRPGQALNMRTIAELNTTLKKHLHRVSEGYDFVVGLPRSGLVPGALVALHLNLPLVTLPDLAAGRLSQRDTNRWGRAHHRLARAGGDAPLSVLVLDDTINTGAAIRRFRATHAETIASGRYRFTFLAIYKSEHDATDADLTFETVPGPRVFEWNLMHHSMSEGYLCDLDGVMCPDGPPENTNDGGLYENYILNAPLKLRPSYKLGAIVTSRLEKWRAQTQAWLAKHDIQYGELIMLDLPTAERRRELQLYGRYKADVYQALGGRLFVESDSGQAHQIAQITGRPVFCTDTGVFIRGKA